ncbi:MFS transporter [Neisseria weixii]|uniref:MFS transporter n=1 Tax=Neisseria weixii TaxID=1853276 RepID=UPI0018F484D2|nr:MFS transporter [Neisseria weixii]
MVTICICLNIIDGFDVLVMAFTASAVAKEWGLSGSEIGLLLSSGLFGMAAGSLTLAPQADKFGRKPVILLSLVVVSVGIILSSFSTSALELGILRFITGLGIGGILASSNVLTSEFSSAKWRSLTISLQSAGYGIGATGGGLVSMYLIKTYGWQSVFLFGGLLSTAFIFVVLRLPESLEFLLSQQPKAALAKAQKLTAKLSLPRLETLPPKPQLSRQAPSGFGSLFGEGKTMPTLMIWAAFFLVMFAFYCILSWTPKLLTGAGMTAEQGISAGIWMDIGSMFGAVLIGFLGTRFNIKTVHAVFLLLTALLTLTFAQSLSQLTLAMALAFFLGSFANGSVAGLYAVAPTLYESANRARGVGTAITLGRAGSIVSPMIIGILLDAGWQPVGLFYLNAVVFALAILAVLKIRKLKPV